MASIDEFLATEFGRSRPGLELVGIEDAALPFSWASVDVLAQERKRARLLEEFTLRAMEAGIFSEGDIGLLLGLEDDLVSATVVDLMQQDYVLRRMSPDGKWRIALTPVGVSAARELSSVTPVNAQLGFAFDRVRWTVTAFKRSDLIPLSEAKQRGLRILPGRPSELSDNDFPANTLNRLLADDEDNDSRVEILIIQLAGNIKHGGLFETAFGITLGELVDDVGGGTASGRPVKAVQVGGPLGAYFPRSYFDTPFDYEAFAARDGLIGHAGVVVFDDTADMAKQARFAFHFCAAESCGKCTPCRIGSTRGRETMDKVIAGQNREANLAVVEDLCNTMKFGSLCALGGFTPYPVMSALTHFPEDFGRPAEKLPAAAE